MLTTDEDGVIINVSGDVNLIDTTLDDSTNGIVLRSAWNYNRDEASVQSALTCHDATRAQQNMKEECDINVIVYRFGLTGHLPEGLRVPLVGDFSEEITDYGSALRKIQEAGDAFMQMPAEIRSRFQNDAGAFVDFVSDPANVQQCRDWGIANAPEAPQAPPEPMLVRVVADSADKAS